MTFLSKVAPPTRSDSSHVALPAICDSKIFTDVENMYKEIEKFAQGLARELTDIIDKLPSPSRLMEMAGEWIKEQLLGDTDRRRLDPSDPFHGGLCLAPSCRGSHVNSGKEEDLVLGGPGRRRDRGDGGGDDEDDSKAGGDSGKAGGGKAVQRIEGVEILASQRTVPTQQRPHAQNFTHARNFPTHALSSSRLRAHTLSRPLVSRPACAVQCVWQALTNLSVCFKVSDVQIDGSGIGDAIKEFWENDPAVQAREPPV